ncbi:MAG: 50S ribosomal protein L35 [Thermoleophilia bacterium]
MPKMKTSRAASKRFRVTRKGKVMFQPSGLRHNMENMSGKKKRQQDGERVLAPEHARTALRLLGKR